MLGRFAKANSAAILTAAANGGMRVPMLVSAHAMIVAAVTRWCAVDILYRIR